MHGQQNIKKIGLYIDVKELFSALYYADIDSIPK